MRARPIAAAVFAFFLGTLSSAAALAQTGLPLDLEFGYRFLSVSGNRDEYRSQVDERQGFLLRNLTFATTDAGGKTHLFDHLRVDGSDLGAGPDGLLRVEVGKTRLYNLRFEYRHAEHFSALTDFANPLFPAVIPGQHTIDRTRNLYDAELELLPGGAITPFIGYTRNAYSGPGRTTYHVGSDEFLLSDRLSDIDQEIRVGAGFTAGPLAGRFVQGWRQFRETDSATLEPGATNGNNPGLVLGVPVTLNGLTRSQSTTTNTPSTVALVTGQLGPRLRLIGAYSRASAEADTHQGEDLSGNLVSFQISRFFAGINETASTRAKSTLWRGSGRAEYLVTDGVDLTVGWSRQHRWLDGFALVSTLYVDTVTFAGQDPKNLLLILDSQNAMDRTDERIDTRLSARGVGPWGAHVGWSRTREEVTVTPDLSEIVVPGGQGGSYTRRIGELNAGVSYGKSGLTLGADYIRERANDPIVRTDFLDRDRYRLRASWSRDPLLRITGTAEQIDSSNDQPGIGYDGRIREYGGEVEVTPVKVLHVHFGAGKYEAKSAILYRAPQDFSVLTSDHRESGSNYEGGFRLALPALALDGSLGRFENSGSYPFTITRIRSRCEVPVRKDIGVAAEWTRDKYDDARQGTGSLARFAAGRYGLFVHWSP